MSSAQAHLATAVPRTSLEQVIEDESRVQVGAEISGRIATVEVDYKQQVRRDQVLARFDRSALEAARKAARLNPLAALRFE